MSAPRDVFHAGERAVQEHAGVCATAAKLGPRMIGSELPLDFTAFLTQASFLYVAAPAADGRIWVSPLFGRSGFAQALDPTQVHIAAVPGIEDPLAAVLAAGVVQAGVLVLEPMSRGRIRLNGQLSADADGAGLTLALSEVFGNCPKYIQRRHPVALAEQATAPLARRSDALDASQRSLIQDADTFIIGSRHAERGADASHRGGRPGFVVPGPDGHGLTFPDYPGNTMFQTLGNLSLDPAVGLLFIDWDSGRTLQLTGTATIDWDSPRVGEWDGAERLVDVQVDQVVDRSDGLPVRWELVESHRLNPAVPGLSRAAAAAPHRAGD